MLAVLFGLASALSWGTGDFSGGLAARKVGAYKAVMWAEAIGLGFVLLALPFVREPFPDAATILWSAAAGVIGAVGLLAFFEAMRRGRLSVVAPLSALLGAVIPVVVGSFVDGMPKPAVFLAFGLALLAIVLISREHPAAAEENRTRPYLLISLLAGIAFGFYFVLIHQASPQLVLAPMIVSRSLGMAAIALYLLLKGEGLGVPSGSWRLLAVNGLFDVGGNFFYILAGQAGRLDVAAVLGSLYPGMTVFLAWIILKERLQFTQWIGILLALIAIILMTVA